MKTKHYLKAIVLLFILGFMACKKGDNGPQGPAGVQGEKGANGDMGPIGPAGEDGSTMYAGDIAPATTIGKVGDYYLNRVSGQLFGPKTAASWGTAIGLKGATGANGTNGSNGTNGADGKNGSKTLSGNGAPSAALGTVGDFYLDKTASYLYGPKAATWGPALELKGKDGNANVRSYIFANPWSLASISSTIGFSFSATDGAFNYTSKELSDNLIQMYVGSSGVWFPANGEQLSSQIITSYFTYPQNRVLVFKVKKADGTSFSDISQLKNYFDNDLNIKIFVITATSTTTLGGLAAGSLELKAALRPYLEK